LDCCSSAWTYLTWLSGFLVNATQNIFSEYGLVLIDLVHLKSSLSGMCSTGIRKCQIMMRVGIRIKRFTNTTLNDCKNEVGM
jgi:hypothetical protein